MSWKVFLLFLDREASVFHRLVVFLVQFHFVVRLYVVNLPILDKARGTETNTSWLVSSISDEEKQFYAIGTRIRKLIRPFRRSSRGNGRWDDDFTKIYMINVT